MKQSIVCNPMGKTTKGLLFWREINSLTRARHSNVQVHLKFCLKGYLNCICLVITLLDEEIPWITPRRSSIRGQICEWHEKWKWVQRIVWMSKIWNINRSRNFYQANTENAIWPQKVVLYNFLSGVHTTKKSLFISP